MQSPDKIHLNAAVGWLELGNWREANEELELISAANRDHNDVLQVRAKIYMAAGKWDYLAEVANAICIQRPDLSFGPIHLAEALRQQGMYDQARAALIAVADKFEKDWQTAFMLARVCCKLGEKAESMKWLEHAIDVTDKKDLRQLALDEPDLQELWVDIAEI